MPLFPPEGNVPDIESTGVVLNESNFETELMKTEFKRMQEREVRLIEIILCFTGFQFL